MPAGGRRRHAGHAPRRILAPSPDATHPKDGSRMIDLATIDDLARRLSGLVPPGLREGRDELQQNFKAVLQAGLSRLDLVTREEFEVQRAVLRQTRAKLEALERTVAEREAPPHASRRGTDPAT